MSVQFDL